MRTFIATITLVLLSHFKVPMPAAELMIIVAIGYGMAVLQDLAEFREKK